MDILYGSLMIVIGMFMLICATRKSETFIYRMLIARSKMMWGNHVRRFYQISGILIIVWAILYMLGIFERF